MAVGGTKGGASLPLALRVRGAEVVAPLAPSASPSSSPSPDLASSTRILSGPVTASAQLGDSTELRLAAVLDHLYRPEGKALVDRLMGDLLKAGVDLHHLPTPGGSTQYAQLLAFAQRHELPIDPSVLRRFESGREVALQFPDLERIPFRKNFRLPAEPTQLFHQVLLVHAYSVMDSVLNASVGYRLDAALPQVVIAALAEAADERGRISVDRAQALLGPRAANFLRAVAASMGTTGNAPAPKLAKGIKYTHLAPNAAVLTKVGASKEAPRALAARMPVLREVADHLKADFSRFEMVAVQHLFPTTGVLFDVFAERGVDPHKSSVLGKNYSADPEVMVRLQGNGWDVVNDNIKPGIVHDPGEVMTYLDKLPEEIRFHSDAQIAPVYHRLSKLFAGLDPNTDRRFLLLDEGGKLVKLLHHYFPQYAHLCVAVEQTDRGIQELEKLALKCPVINVARSEAKKTWESPMIGENVVAATLAQIADLAPGMEPNPKQAAIIGYGAVGKASADALRRRGYTVHVYDTDPAKMAQAEKDGCQPAASRDALLAKGSLLFSATGRTTLEPADYERLPRGAILVNAASGNHELGAHLLHEAAHAIEEAERKAAPPRGPFDLAPLPDLDERVVHPYSDGQDLRGDDGRWRTQLDGREIDLGSALDDDSMRHSVVRTPGGNEVLLIRSGYVVNLSDDIPPEFIQLTRSLLYAACAQATKAKTAGLVALDADAQTFIVKRTQAHLIKAKLSLSQPDFRKVG